MKIKIAGTLTTAQEAAINRAKSYHGKQPYQEFFADCVIWYKNDWAVIIPITPPTAYWYSAALDFGISQPSYSAALYNTGHPAFDAVPSTFTAIYYVLFRDGVEINRWTAAVQDNGGGYSFISASGVWLPIPTEFVTSGLILREYGSLPPAPNVLSIYPIAGRTAVNFHGSVAATIYADGFTNPWGILTVRRLFPGDTFTPSATQKQVGDFSVSVPAAAWDINEPGIQDQIAVLVGEAELAVAGAPAALAELNAAFDAQMATALTDAMALEIKTNHPVWPYFEYVDSIGHNPGGIIDDRGVITVIPPYDYGIPPALSVEFGGVYNNETCIITFTRDVAGEQVTSVIEGSRIYTAWSTYSLDGGDPDTWNGYFYVTNHATTVYVNWPEFTTTTISEDPLITNVSLIAPFLQPTLRDGTDGEGSTSETSVLPGWDEWNNSHAPIEISRPATENLSGLYDVRMAEGEIVDIIPIHRVDDYLGDMGAMWDVAAAGREDHCTNWIRYVYRYKYNKATGFTHLDTREYTTSDGERILFPPSTFFAEGNIWLTPGRCIVISRKAAFNGMRDDIQPYGSQLTYSQQALSLGNPYAAVREALAEGVFVSI